VLSTNNRGFRGDRLVEPKPGNEYRIFVVGGSTVETFALDDADALNAVLQRSLQEQAPGPSVVKVFNAGVSGQWSAGHVSVVVHRLVHLEPDMIIVLAGINDLRAAINELDYLHYEPERHYGPFALLKMLATELQLFRRLYYLVANTRARQARVDGLAKIDYRAAVAERLATPVSDRPPRTDLGPYVRNLETIAGVAKVHGIQLVFVTQQTTWNSDVDSSAGKRQWMLYTKDVHYRADRMDAALREYNDAMKAVGARLSVPVYDLARLLPKSGEYIYDDVHLGVQGALTTGRGLAAFIHSLGLMDRSVSPTTRPLDEARAP
jgi:lysophospholipase L1-like esterase